VRVWSIAVSGLLACGDGRTVSPDADGATDAAVDAPPFVSCIPAAPAPPPLSPAKTTPGTRLVPRTIAEVGGLDVLWSIRDTALGVDCEPRSYVDGTIRCVPLVNRSEEFQAWGDYFADATRTIPVALLPLAAAPPTGTLGASFYENSDVEGVFHCRRAEIRALSRLGPQRVETEFFTSSMGPQTVFPGYGMFSLTPEPLDFVALEEVRTQLVGAIAVRELQGSDGSRLFPRRELYDYAHDAPVYLHPFSGFSALGPSAVQSLALHLEPSPDNLATPAYCNTPDLGLFSIFDRETGCDVSELRYVQDTSIHGVELKTGTLHGCVSVQGQLMLTTVTGEYFQACDTQPDSLWARVTESNVGAGQLQAAQMSIDGVSYGYARNHFEDTVRGFQCVAHAASDGSLRCLPLESGVVAFNDPACTNRIATSAVFGGTATFGVEWTVPTFGFPDLSVRGRATIFNVGAQRPDETVYFRTPESCVSVGVRPTWDLGTVRSPSSFAALELRDVPP
jgi:hypothetical protein